MTEDTKVMLINTGSIRPNQTKLEMYKLPENYDSIKKSIQNEGIIEPLLVNKKTNVIISGNLRLQIAKELGLPQVPVIFTDIKEDEMDVKSISTNQTRTKSYSEILREIEFFEKHYAIKRGQRTDLKPEVKKIKEDRDAFLNTVSRTTREKVKSIASMAEKIYGRDSEQFKGVFRSLDNQKTTLNGLHQHLLDVMQRKRNEEIIPKTYNISRENTKIYNKSCEDMSEVATESINAIITSPPYFLMKVYDNGENELGQEREIELYLLNLMKIFKECHRVLRNDGSLFVNINDCVLGGRYQAVPHYFVVKMLEIGWILNDEFLWIKRNPTYTRGKRSVRSHEPIFHFVKSSDFYYTDEWLKDLADKEDKISYGINKSSPKVRSGMDFRDGVLTTNVANTQGLRKKSKIEKGIHLTHSATFPIDVPAVCALLTTREGDTILDCFAGTSTVGRFARLNNRKFVGYELNPQFVMASEVNLMDIPNWNIIFNIPSKTPMISFSTGIESFKTELDDPQTTPIEYIKPFKGFTKMFNRSLRFV